MLTISVEGREAQFVPRCGAGKRDFALVAGVRYDQRAALMYRGQNDDQGGHHTIELFPIAVRQEKTPLLIHQ